LQAFALAAHFCLCTLPFSFPQEICSNWLVPKRFSDVLLSAVVLAFMKVVMDIPMPGHPHQSAEVLHSNVAAWDGNCSNQPQTDLES